MSLSYVCRQVPSFALKTYTKINVITYCTVGQQYSFFVVNES